MPSRYVVATMTPAKASASSCWSFISLAPKHRPVKGIKQQAQADQEHQKGSNRQGNRPELEHRQAEKQSVERQGIAIDIHEFLTDPHASPRCQTECFAGVVQHRCKARALDLDE